MPNLHEQEPASDGARRNIDLDDIPARSAFRQTSIRAVEEHVARKMGLVPEPISTQGNPRDRQRALFAALGVVASR